MTTMYVLWREVIVVLSIVSTASHVERDEKNCLVSPRYISRNSVGICFFSLLSLYDEHVV